jgi:bisanhydrobacterioruberin hydratase
VNPGETKAAAQEKSISKPEKFLTGLLAVMFPVGLYIMFSDFGRQFIWTTTLFLSLQAFTLLLVLIKLSTLRTALTASLIIFVLSFTVEFIGVKTGYPFGDYSYSTLLAPLISGVPLAIAFAWFSVTLSSLLFVKLMLPYTPSLTLAFVSAVIILAMDVLLEPFASVVNGFWIWNSSNIPIQNFISWFVIGFIFSLILDKIPSWNGELIKEGRHMRVPVFIIALNVLNFAVLNFWHGFYLLTAVGIVLIVLEVIIMGFFCANEA